MNRPHLSSNAPRHRYEHLAEHLSGSDRRRRRRMAQRCSAVVATLFLGTSQCDGPAASSASHATPPATPVVSISPLAIDPPEQAAHAATPSAGPTPVTTPVTTPVAAPGAVVAERVVVPGPDGTEVPGRCTQYEDLLMIHAPAIGWDVLRMSRLAWRESNCWAVIRSRTSDSGLLQINDVSLTFLNDALGEQVDPFTLMDPVQNVRAAAALCTFWARNGSSCYQPWSAT